jgi:hypothetical protein
LGQTRSPGLLGPSDAVSAPWAHGDNSSTPPRIRGTRMAGLPTMAQAFKAAMPGVGIGQAVPPEAWWRGGRRA